MLKLLFLLFCFVCSINSITFTSHGLSYASCVFINFTATTNEVTSLYAQYYPTAGEFGKIVTLRSLPSLVGTSHLLFFSRLYANTTYHYDIYQKGTTSPSVLSGSFTTCALPLLLSETNIEVINNPESPRNELILTNLPNFFGTLNYIYKFDDTGSIVWFLPINSSFAVGFGMSENTNLTLYLDAVNSLQAYQPWGTLVETGVTDGCANFHHEVDLDPFSDQQNLFWALNIELIYNYNGASPPVPVQAGDKYMLWNITTNKITQINNISQFISPVIRTPLSDLGTFGLVFASCINSSVVDSTVQDWTHGNSLRRSLHHNRYMVYSSRSLSTVFIFDQFIQKLLYIVGGPISMFTFPNPLDIFLTQHSASILPNVDESNQYLQLLVYDDGVGSLRNSSRALLLRLDLVTFEATKIWDYTLPPSIVTPPCLSNFTGSAFQLNNGDYLVDFPTCNWGFYFTGTSYVAHLNRHGHQRWVYKANLVGAWFYYRAYESNSVAGEIPVA